MSGEFEAAGALATAGAVAGAIEGREPGQAGEGACPNCGAQIVGPFCAQCGQATHAERSLAHLIGEFLHNLFYLDTKIWRTLPMAVFRPGTLTRNYVYGKRARYLSPLTLFLLAIFFMFFVFSFFHAPVNIHNGAPEQRAAAARELAEARDDLAQAQRELTQQQTAPDADDGSPRGLGLRLAQQGVQLAEAGVARRQAELERIDAEIARRAQASANAETAADAASSAARDADPAAPAPATPAPADEQQAPASAATPAANADAPSADDDEFMRPGETWQDAFRRTAAKEDFSVMDGNPALNERVRQSFANPDLMLYKMQEAASKFAFLLAPLSLPFIALLFLWKRRVNLYDHVVYALYALSFASLLFVAVMLTAQAPWTQWLTPWLVIVGLPVHTYFHLGGAYALGWWSALWRTFFMLTFACIILTIFLTMVLILGLVG